MQSSYCVSRRIYAALIRRPPAPQRHSLFVAGSAGFSLFRTVGWDKTALAGAVPPTTENWWDCDRLTPILSHPTILIFIHGKSPHWFGCLTRGHRPITMEDRDALY